MTRHIQAIEPVINAEHRLADGGQIDFDFTFDSLPDAPRSVTVAASSCTEAGFLSTLAMLKGKKAGGFLERQEVRFWMCR